MGLQSNDNRIRTEAIYAALAVALERLEKMEGKDRSRWSVQGILRHALKIRKAELTQPI